MPADHYRSPSNTSTDPTTDMYDPCRILVVIVIEMVIGSTTFAHRVARHVTGRATGMTAQAAYPLSRTCLTHAFITMCTSGDVARDSLIDTRSVPKSNDPGIDIPRVLDWVMPSASVVMHCSGILVATAPWAMHRHPAAMHRALGVVSHCTTFLTRHVSSCWKMGRKWTKIGLNLGAQMAWSPQIHHF